MIENTTCNMKLIIIENEETIRKLNETVSESDKTIAKLHKRCAGT